MNQKLLHYLSVAVILFLSGLFLYFYLTGRIDPYVAPEFRRWALLAGLGLAVLGLFNLVTARQAVSCGHDHSHDHDHDHDHGDAKGGCSHPDHDHSHDHDHDHAHSHDHDDGGCCEYGHAHNEEEAEHHHHGDSPANVVMALVILTLPMLIAMNSSVDRFSTEYAIRWGNITEKLHRMELKRAREREQVQVAAAAPSSKPASTSASAADTPPATPAASGADVSADTPPASAPVGAEAGAGVDSVENADAVAGTDDDGWGEFTLEDLKRMVPQNEAGSFLLEVPQLFYTANDTELQRVLEGLPIETIAQVMPDSGDKGVPSADAEKRLRLFRMFIECCAADMRPLPVTIQFEKSIPEYEEMGWVKVIGKVRYEHIDGITTPIIDVKTMEATAEPMDMMVY